MATSTFGEVSITGALLDRHLAIGEPYGTGGNRVTVPPTVDREVVAAIDAAEAAGARRLLLVVASFGGWVASAHMVGDRLRRFREAGGVIVAHVTKADSSAPRFALEANYVVLDPAGRFLIHGAGGSNPERGHEVMAAALSSRTGMDAGLLKSLMDSGPQAFTAICGDVALQQGFADEIGTLERARALAAGGALRYTWRAQRIALQRPAPPVTSAPAARAAQSSESTFTGTLGGVSVSVRAAMAATAKWAEVSLPAASYWTACWTGRLWIVAGSGNNASASPDVNASSWAAKALGVPGATWTGSATDGAGRVLFVGATSACSLSTNYGSTFTSQTIPIDAKAVCWDTVNARFVAVGTGVCATSATGATGSWTTRTIPNLPAGYSTHYEAVAASGSTLCAVGWTDFYHGIASVSGDGGATWTAHDLYAGASQTLASVVATVGGFVAVDVMDPGYIWITGDGGATWTAHAGPGPSKGRAIATDGYVLMLMSATEYQSVAPNPQYPCGWVSTDGGSFWTARYGPRQASANKNCTALAFNGTHWVAVAEEAVATVSQQIA